MGILIYISCLIISLAFILAREFLFSRERQQWQDERQKLIDRIQASNFVEYKTMTEPVKQEKKEDEPEYEFI